MSDGLTNWALQISPIYGLLVLIVEHPTVYLPYPGCAFYSVSMEWEEPE